MANPLDELHALGDSLENALKSVGGEPETQESQSAQKTKKTFSTQAEELAHYKESERQQRLERLADEKAELAVQGMKARLEAEDAAIDKMVEDKVAARMQELLTGAGLKSAVSAAVAETRMGRKTPAEYSDRDMFTNPVGRTAPALISSRGEKANLTGFMAAIARKDYATIADIQHRGGIYHSGKALSEGRGAGNAVDGPSGGWLVPPEYSTDLIDLLYAKVVVRAAGAQIMEMESPQFYRPRLSIGATASYVGENAPIPTSQETFEQFSLNAKILTAIVPISNFLLRDSNPKAEQVVKENIAKQIALKEDITFLYGAGGNVTPQGILTASGTQQITAVAPTTGDAASYNMIVDMETLLDSANVPDIKRVYIAHPRLRGALRKIVDNYGRPIFMEYMNPQEGTLLPGQPNGFNGMAKATLFGRPFFTSSQIPLGFGTNGTTPTTDLALVEMSEVIIGQVGQIEMDASSEATYQDAGGNVISAFQANQTAYRCVVRHDIGLDHVSCVVRRQQVQY